MAAPVIQVDYQELENISLQFADQQKRVHSVLQALQTSTDQLRRGGWVTESATSFYQDMDQNVLPAVQRLDRAMQKSEHMVRDVIRLMKAAEQEALGYINNTQESSATPSEPRFMLASATLGNVLGISSDNPASSQFPYVSQVNRHLFDALLKDEELLETRRSELDGLYSERTNKQAELDQLRERLNDLNEVSGSNPFDWLDDGVEYLGSRISGEYGRVQESIAQLETDIANLDNQISAGEAGIGNLQNGINEKIERLKLVTPPVGSDVDFIRRMENSKTEAWLRPYTMNNGQGTCTTHVIDKIAMPREMIRTAAEWNDQARANPRFGIQVAEKPLAGSVLVMERDHPYASSVAGHVMYVERVENGEVYITDNNHSTPVSLSQLGVKPTDGRISYLYIPWHTRV